MVDNEKSSMVFIPDYVYDSLVGYGISLEEIANVDRPGVNVLVDKILKLLSVNDLSELELVNQLMYNVLYKTKLSDVIYSGGYNDVIRHIYNITYNSDEDYNKIINLYYNKKISDDDVLMSDNNKIYTVKHERNVVFVIIHDGFTNFIVNNNKEISDVLSKRLLDYCVKGLGKDNFDKSYLVKLAIKNI